MHYKYKPNTRVQKISLLPRNYSQTRIYVVHYNDKTFRFGVVVCIFRKSCVEGTLPFGWFEENRASHASASYGKIINSKRIRTRDTRVSIQESNEQAISTSESLKLMSNSNMPAISMELRKLQNGRKYIVQDYVIFILIKCIKDSRYIINLQYS